MLSNYGAWEDSWESLGLQEIKPINPKENQPWLFTESADAKSEAPILWPLDGKGWLIGKDSDAGKDWRQKEKGMAEKETFVDSITDSMDINLNKLGNNGAWCAVVNEVAELNMI